MTETMPLVAVRDLQLEYRTGKGVLRAVQGATLTVQPGQAVGLVGESGSGKSTLARALLGLTDPRHSAIVGGAIEIEGRDVTHLGPAAWEKLRGHPLAMVFQDPLSYLNPVMRIDRQIAESVRRHDPAADPQSRVAELLDMVKLPRTALRAYPHELSGGMRQRVLMAVALGCRPKLLVADEPTTALDVTTQAEIMTLLRDLRQRLGMAMLLISHDLALVASACDYVYVMYAGHIVEWGEAASLFGAPAHPYTVGLLRSARAERNEAGRFETIPGDVPNLAKPVEGCPFAPRCANRIDACRVMPGPTPVGGADLRNDHWVRCWKPAG